MVQQTKQTKTSQRITSIDALRAFALFGIITVHSVGRFCVPGSIFEACSIDTLLSQINGALFENRFASIFAILFGISFYIILRKPNYPTSRFVWRCFLLFCIGLFNKFFYRADALMLYGFCGMILAAFRGLSNKQLLYLIVLLIFGGYLMSISDLGSLAEPFIGDISSRYIPGSHDWGGVLSFWPHSVLWYVEHALYGSILITLAKFSLGYYIGRVGLVEKMDKIINLKILAYTLLAYSFTLAMYFVTHNYMDISFTDYMFKQARNFTGAIFYAITFIYFYNHTSNIKPFLKHLENYGKLGLSNYTFQGIFMVVLLSDIGLASSLTHAWEILPIAWCLFFVQIIFSSLWLKYFCNGPIEYLWRCATSLKWMQLRR